MTAATFAIPFPGGASALFDFGTLWTTELLANAFIVGAYIVAAWLFRHENAAPNAWASKPGEQN